MKKDLITIQRMFNHYRKIHETLYIRQRETRYSLENVLKASTFSNEISLQTFFRKLEIQSFSELNLISGKNVSNIIFLFDKQHPTMFYKNDKELSGTYNVDNFLICPALKNDKEKFSVEKILSVSENESQRADIIYTLGETSRILRACIAMRSTSGYYWMRPVKIPEKDLEKTFDHFETTNQLEKKARLAERTQHYDIASETFLRADYVFASAECLYLNGEVDKAINLYINEAENPTSVLWWLDLYVSEHKLAKEYVPKVIQKLKNDKKENADEYISEIKEHFKFA
jgi:hypothetical protein